MVVREQVFDEEGTHVLYRCEHDGTVLMREYSNGAIVGNSCSHYHWEMVGNGCYPIKLNKEICAGVEEIVRESIKKIDEGLTIWFLVPKSQ